MNDIKIINAHLYNLKNINISIPINITERIHYDSF